MKKFKKSLLIGALSFGLVNVSACSLNRKSAFVEKYVKSNLEIVIKEQEEKMGIKHFGIPLVSYEFPEVYDDTFMGGYISNNDEIIISKKNIVSSDNKVISFFRGYNGLDGRIKKTLYHELGHYYTDKLSESVGNGNWPVTNIFGDPYERLGALLVCEGIAEYFERKMVGEVIDLFSDEDWPKEVSSLWNPNLMYPGGYHLVKPILDSYWKKGIEHLIINPPKEKELHNLPEYQKKTLNYLEKH